MDNLQSQYRIVAGGDNVKDVIKLLSIAAERAADIRTPIYKEADTVETRRAICSYLQEIIDRLSRVNDNYMQSSAADGISDDR